MAAERKCKALVVANDYLSCPVAKYHPLRATLSDGRLMVGALQQLGFRVSHRTNVTKQELIEHLTNLMEPRNVYDLAVVCFVYCGHGEDDCLVTQEGNKITLKEILEQFQGIKHPELADKIKLIFIDACRGDRKDNGVVITRGVSVCETIHLSENSNSLVAYSTQAGYESQELHHPGQRSEGLWIPLLATNITSQDAPLLDVLVDVNAQVHRKVKELEIRYQTPDVVHSLTEVVNLHRIREVPLHTMLQRVPARVPLTQPVGRGDLQRTDVEVAERILMRDEQLRKSSQKRDFEISSVTMVNSEKLSIGVEVTDIEISGKCRQCSSFVAGRTAARVNGVQAALHYAWYNLFMTYSDSCICKL